MASALLIAACDTTDPSLHTPEVVVESYQVANEPLGAVRLSYTADVGDVYDFTALSVKNAEVRIDLMQGDGTVETSFAYAEVDTLPGVYVSANAVATVQPLRTYRLSVQTQQGETVTAETFVPGAFTVLAQNGTDFTYPGNAFAPTEQPELTVTRSDYPGRNAFYIFSTEALDASVAEMTPLYVEIIYDDDVTADSLRRDTEYFKYVINESPILNEDNYIIAGDQIAIQLPWLAVAFFGPHRVTVNAIDDNVYDYIRSLDVQGGDGGNGTTSPGELPNLIDHIDGGIGIFGSFARQSSQPFTINRPAELRDYDPFDRD